MIHIIHTPAATLASRRRRLAGHCACWSVTLGCLAGSCAVQMPVLQATGAPPCNFRGIAFIPQEKPPAVSRKLQLFQLAAATAPSLPPLPALTADFEICTGEMELLQTEAADDLQLETDAEALLKQPTASASHQKQLVNNSDSAYSPPSFLNCPKPPYPPRMKQRKVQGCVGVLIHINADGAPSAVTITDTCGNPQLDRHTRNWIMQHWRFTPARMGNSPLASEVKTRINYTLL